MAVPGRRRSVRASDPSSHDWNKKPPTDVHTQLGALLHSYSVFRPVSPSHLPLFQVGLVLSSPASRALSPQPTSANLQTIFSYQPSAPLPLSSCPGDATKAFQHEFAKVRVSSLSPLDTVQKSPPTRIVSEASLFRAGMNFGAGMSKRHCKMREISLSNVSSEEYVGGRALHRLIWTHAESVFRQVLLEIDMNLGLKSGDRHLIAIVTKTVQANVSVSKKPVNPEKGRAHVKSPGARNMTSSSPVDLGAISHDHEAMPTEESFEASVEYGGICGVHFLVFPVEVLDSLKWRVYRGITLTDVEHPSEALTSSDDRFVQAQKWHLKHVSDLPFTGDGDGLADNDTSDTYAEEINDGSDQPCSERLPFRLYHAESEAGSTITDHAMPPDDKSNQKTFNDSGDNWKPSRGATISPAWIDIDFSNGVNEFALKQCDLAARYRASGMAQQTAHSIMLLRSAMQKCCSESGTRALADICDCYEQGVGVKKSESDAEKLRFCLQMWEEGRPSEVSLDALREDRKFCHPKQPPERRILQLMREAGLHKGLKRGRNGCLSKDKMPVRELWKRMRRFQEELDDTETRMAELEGRIRENNPLWESIDADSNSCGIEDLYLRQNQIDALLSGIPGGLDEECLDEERLGEESMDEEWLDEESLDEERLDEERLDEG